MEGQGQCGDAGPCEPSGFGPAANDPNGFAGSGASNMTGDEPRPMEGMAPDGGIAPPPGEGNMLPPPRVTLDGSAGSLQGAIDDLTHALCACTPDLSYDECTETSAAERECERNALMANAQLAGSWLMCAAEYMHEAAECVHAAACNFEAIMQCAFFIEATSESDMDLDAVTARCGLPPAQLDQAMDACDGQPATGCANGQPLPAGGWCNGVMECSDGSDEALCGEDPADPDFVCGSGEKVPGDWHCDGESDCRDASDELGCAGLPEFFDCGDGASIPSSWVCDMEADCSNGSDELECQ